MAKYDYLVVGAGLYGAVIAREAADAGKKVLVLDKRPHIAGNIYTQKTEGIQVHTYGAHIFHTNDDRVWEYVQRFAGFNRFTNAPVANFQGELYSLPFNMYTFNKMWGVTTPQQAMAEIQRQRQAAGITEPKNLEEQAISLVGIDIYERLVKGYTEKQWGRPCTELPAFIIRRLPVRMVYDNNYFNDAYQGIPIGGYNQLIEGLLNGVDTQVNTDFFANREKWEAIADKIVFTGKIDEYYDYRFGKLDYRTVRFETETIDTANYQGNAVINYTDRETPYTRVIEHKHFESFGQSVYDNPKTIISREYSTEWQDGMEPFYPVNDDKNTALYQQYKQLADKETNVIFGGRLAEYKYYDMAPIIEKGLELEM